MKAIRGVLFCAALSLVGVAHAAGPVSEAGPSATVEGDPATADIHQSFTITAPTEFRGVWNRQFQPFLDPVDMQSWANVRVESIDAGDGSVSGHFDVYVRSLCWDVVDQPFKGTFNGKELRLSYEFTQCPGMKPLHVTLWKEADGFHGRTMGFPITINKVITASNP